MKNSVEQIFSNIKSISYFLASKKDIDANLKFHQESEEKDKELTSDITDLKLFDLKFNLKLLYNYFTEMENCKTLRFKICIASSNSLKEEREEIETFLSWKNDKLFDNNIYLHYNVWEKQSLRFNRTYKQEDFNKSLVYDSDIFICLIGDNVGKFTKEEFDEAKKRFDLNEKPYIIYIYFKEFKNKDNSFYESDGWKKRIELKNHILNEFQQYHGTFENKHELIGEIDRHLEEDIEIVKKIIASKSL